MLPGHEIKNTHVAQEAAINSHYQSRAFNVTTGVDFPSRIITIRAFNTKTLRERQVAMTDRVRLELEWLFEQSAEELDALVFGVNGSIKKAFNTARRAASAQDEFNTCQVLQPFNADTARAS